MIDTTWTYLIWVVFTAFIGMIAIGAGVIGFWMRKLNWIERIVSLVTGLCLIYPEKISDIVGLVLFAILLTLQYFYKRDHIPKVQN
jgi:TRAP-type uncharacterized transport system fused permease subunit